MTDRIGRDPRFIGGPLASIDDAFPDDVEGLPLATETDIVELDDGDTLSLYAGPIRKHLGDTTVRMLAYNRSIPGPTIRVQERSAVTVEFWNNMDLDTTVHWHGLRLDNQFDGVAEGPHRGMQPPIPPGGSFTYRLTFPDPGVYWYHPHIREDYTQEHGLYGNIIVEPDDPDYWLPVDREQVLVLDDILIEDSRISPFSRSEPTTTARFGNAMLLNGDTEYGYTVEEGEVVRFYLTNTANARTFNVRIPGVNLKLVGGDNGRVEHEEFVESITVSPSERAIVDVLFEDPGDYSLEHRSSKHTYTLGTITAKENGAGQSYVEEFHSLRRNSELEAERERLLSEEDFERESDKTLILTYEAESEQDRDVTQGHLHHSHGSSGWRIVDEETGAANMDIDWSFERGTQVKIRIVNDASISPSMAHPMHFHGERFLVLACDNEPNDNLVWKDTVHVESGETLDILLDVTNPGLWMAHCHIAEHVEGGMMFTFNVRNGDDE